MKRLLFISIFFGVFSFTSAGQPGKEKQAARCLALGFGTIVKTADNYDAEILWYSPDKQKKTLVIEVKDAGLNVLNSYTVTIEVRSEGYDNIHFSFLASGDYPPYKIWLTAYDHKQNKNSQLCNQFASDALY